MKRRIIAISFLAALIVAPTAHAATTEELLSLIHTLQAELSALTAKIATTITPPVITRTLDVGAEGADVVALQAYLKALGFYTHPTTTGFFGPVTQAAVTAYQQANGLPGVGAVGPLTMAKLAGVSPTPPPPANYVADAPTKKPASRDRGHGGSAAEETPIPVTLATLTLSASTIVENSPADTVVGTLQGTTTGSTLSLTDTAGGRFKVVGDVVMTDSTVTDYETTASHNITVRETYAGATNTPLDTILSITVTNTAEGTLSALTLSAATVPENSAADTVVGTLQGTTTGSTLSLTDSATGRFKLVAGVILTDSVATNYESATSHSITVRETYAEAANSPRDTILAITVTNVAEGTLSALTLSASTIAENSPADTVVGTLQSTTTGSTLSLTDTASGRFKLVGGVILADSVATDYEGATSHNITVRETYAEASNSPRDTTLAISVTDVYEATSAARWRVRVYGAQGLDGTTGAGAHSIAELKFMTSAGAGAQPTTGTPISSNDGGGGAKANAFDGSNSTYWYDGANADSWLGYTFDSAVAITHVSMTSRDSFYQTPKTFFVEYSTNGGSSWNTAAYIVSSNWTAAAQTKVVSLATAYPSNDLSALDEPGGYRYWAIKAKSPGSYAGSFNANQTDILLKRNGTSIGPDQHANRGLNATVVNSTPFNNVTGDNYWYFGAADQYVMVDFGYKRVVDQVGVLVRSGFPSQALRYYEVWAGNSAFTLASMSLITTVDDNTGTPTGGTAHLFSIP
ncbi:MAG: peptidoglycan-binding protein [Patescibacteria group bacterium]